MITASEAKELVAFKAIVTDDFTARWANPILRDGKLVDYITERKFNFGEVVYCNSWRPEGMMIKREKDDCPMFVFWRHFKNLEIA